MQVRLGSLPGTYVRAIGGDKAAPALLVHGMGLGRWTYERLQLRLARAGVPSVAVDLPGHGPDAGRDVTLDAVIDAVTEAVDDLGSCQLVGHSLGGYVCQVVMGRRQPESVVLINPFPTRGILPLSRPAALKHAGPLLRAVVTGRAAQISLQVYLDSGLDLVAPEHQQECFELVTPWPASLLRDMARQPHRVDPAAVQSPVLVQTGKRDVLVPPTVARLIGDRFDALVWRYDDLGHMALLQEEGRRLEADLTDFVLRPRSRKVTETDAFSPGEGVGYDERKERRGREGARRSAYGQRAGRQGQSAMQRWDQNLAPDATALPDPDADGTEDPGPRR